MGTRTRGASISDGAVSIGQVDGHATGMRWTGGFGSTWMVDAVCQIGRKHSCTSSVRMETICTKEMTALPEEIEVIDKVQSVDVACR